MICKECGKDFPDTHKPGTPGRKKEFCSEECKRRFHEEHRVLKYSKVCGQCGRNFATNQKTQKYCGVDCKAAARKTGRTFYKKTCPYCGKEFETIYPLHQFCSSTCGARYTGAQRRGTYYCEYCGKPRWSDNPNRNRYCSKRCAGYAKYFGTAEKRAEMLKEKEDALNKVCPNCKKAFRAKNRLQCYCSHECQEAGQRANKREQYSMNYTSREFTCKECGKTVVTELGVRNSIYCSQACMSKAENRRYHEKRKQFMKEAFVEPVGIMSVYKRANGVCEICGLPVPNDKSPENVWGITRDHIVPLSKGGLHEQSNCQLAHRICNSMKLDSMDSNFRIDWGQKLLDEPGKWNEKLDDLWTQLGDTPPGPPIYPKIQFPRGTVRPFL